MKAPHLIATLILTITILGCTDSELRSPEQDEPKNVLPEFSASTCPDETKTFLDEYKVKWSNEDLVAICAGTNYIIDYKVKEGYAGGSSTILTPLRPNREEAVPINANVAFYPFEDVLSINSTGEKYLVKANIPARQTYSYNSFGKGSMPMIAVSSSVKDTKLSFKNLYGVLKLRMKMKDITISTITIQGNSNETIAGPALITCSNNEEPDITFTNNDNTTITLYCGKDGINISEKTDNVFYIPLPPIVFDKGITVTFYTKTGEKIVRKTDKEVTILRSTILPMPEISDDSGKEFDERIIHITEPGTLSSLISLEDIRKVRNLKIIGEMNDLDIAMMTHSFRSVDKTIYKTETLDLSEASFPDNILHGFNGLAYLKSVKLPPTIKKIRGSKGAFDGCTSLTDIDFGENPQLEVLGSGIWQNYNSLDYAMIYCGAFSNCTSLKELSIPESVTTIEGGAFYGSGIEKITFAKNCQIESFDGFKVARMNSLGAFQTYLIGTFYGCDHLKTIDIPSSVMMITESAFSGWTGLETLTIPETVKYLSGTKLFSGCTSLKLVRFPSSIIEISESMFEGCKSLTSFIFPGGLKSIKANAFRGCSSLNTINLDNVTDIAPGAFSDCGFTSIKIPDSMTIIPEGLFEGCKSLKNIDLNKTKEIGDIVFYDCPALTEITLPKELRIIGKASFSRCDNLERVNVMCDSAVFGTNSFSAYEEKVQIKFHIAANVKSLTIKESDYFTDGIFDGRKIIDMSNFIFEDGTQCSEFGLLGETDISDMELPAHITKLGQKAFAGCKNLTSVSKLLKHIKVIGDYCFVRSNIKKAIIPEGVVQIGKSAFAGCDNLIMYSMPNSISKIGETCFSGCNKLVTSTINGNDIEFCGKYTTSDGIFTGCNQITKITIGKNVKSLSQVWENQRGERVYDSYLLSKNIKEVTFEEGSNCYSIKGAVFGAGASGRQYKVLETMTIPSTLTTVGSGAFFNQSKITIPFPEKLDTIGCGAFYECKAISCDHMIIPKNCKTIGIHALPKWTYKTFTINSKFTKYEDCHYNIKMKPLVYAADEWIINVPIDDSFSAWANSIGLDTRSGSITIAEGIESIADEALYSFSSTTIKLPSTIKVIGVNALPFFTSLYCKATTPPKSSELKLNKDVTIYVPPSSVEKYKSSEGWKAYADKIQAYDFQ